MDENQEIKISFTAELSDTEKKLDSVLWKLKEIKDMSKFNINFGTSGSTGKSRTTQTINTATQAVSVGSVASRAISNTAPVRLSDAFANGDLAGEARDTSAAVDYLNNRFAAAMIGANALMQPLRMLGSVAKDTASTGVKMLGVGLSTVGNTLKNIAKKPFVSFANSVKNATKGVSRLFSSLKRIAMYRALRTMIKAITDGFKEGTENAYRWAVVNNNQLATSLDALKTESSYLKNSIGAMVAPIINALVPAIQTAVSAVVDFINALNQLFALIGGQSTWIKANKQARSFGENLKSAGGAAKTLTTGIDELNILSESSGGGGADLDYANMFSEESLSNSPFANFVQRIKDDIAKEDFRDIGAAIAEKFNQIDFKSLLSDGIQIGLKIVTAIGESISGFLEKGNWQSLGKQIVDGIFEGFEKGDFDRAARSIFELLGAGVGAAFGLLAGIVEGIAGKWQEYWEGIFLPYMQDDGRLTIDEILFGIVDALVGIADWIETNIFSPFISGFKAAFGINGDSSSEMNTQGHHVIKGLWEGIKANWDTIPQFFQTKLTALKTDLTNKWDEMKQTAKDKWDAIKQNLDDTWENIKKTADDKWTSVKTNLFNTWDSLKSTAETKFKDIKDDIELKWSALKATTETTWSTLKTALGTKWESIRQNADTKFQNISSTIQSVWGVIKTNTETKWTDIKSKFLETWDKMKEGIKAPINAILSSVETFVNRIIRGINSAIDAFNELFSIETANGGSIGLHFDHIPTVSIPRLYTGGFMDSGQLYSVREGGIPEYVGRYGTRAAVANNEQIVDGIAYGVADANENVVAMLSQILTTMQGMNLQVNIGDREIGQANERYTNERGVYVNSGAFAGAY